MRSCESKHSPSQQSAVAVACFFVCHFRSAAEESAVAPCSVSPKAEKSVISTEATDSLTVCCAVERPPHFARTSHTFPLPCRCASPRVRTQRHRSELSSTKNKNELL